MLNVQMSFLSLFIETVWSSWLKISQAMQKLISLVSPDTGRIPTQTWLKANICLTSRMGHLMISFFSITMLLSSKTKKSSMLSTSINSEEWWCQLDVWLQFIIHYYERKALFLRTLSFGITLGKEILQLLVRSDLLALSVYIPLMSISIGKNSKESWWGMTRQKDCSFQPPNFQFFRSQVDSSSQAALPAWTVWAGLEFTTQRLFVSLNFSKARLVTNKWENRSLWPKTWITLRQSGTRPASEST